MEASLQDFTIEHLIHAEDLSVRAINVCQSNGFINLKEIIDYYKANGTFCKIRNCGVGTDRELVRLVKKYFDIQSVYNRHHVQLIENDINSLFKQLNPYKKSILHKYVDYLVSTLSVRARNGINNILNQQLVNSELDFILSPTLKFDQIKNIGSKTLDELNEMKKTAISFFIKIQQLPTENLNKEYARIILLTVVKGFSLLEDDSTNELFDLNGKIRLFHLLDLLLESKIIFNNNEKAIIQHLYYNGNNIITLDRIAIQLDLTRERVRQIRKKLREELHTYLTFISSFKIEDFINYGIDGNSKFYIVDTVLVNKISGYENVNFNSQLYCLIFALLLSKSHSLLANTDQNLINGQQLIGKAIQNNYLISNEILKSFQIGVFLSDLNDKLSDKILENYELHFRGYVSQFFNGDSKIDFEVIYDICEQLIFNEYQLFVNENGYIVIERNTKPLLYQYCYKILLTHSSPMTVDEIREAVNSEYPDVNPAQDTIRSTLSRRDLFIYFGRSSTYGLRIWETEKDNLKGGTIREIAAEYLAGFDEPKRLSNIVEYLLRFRQTNEKSVLNNLKSDESQRFVFFKNLIIGLKTKNYKNTYSSVSHKLRTWEEKYEELKQFIQANPNRWPSILSKNKSERSMYMFGLRSRQAFKMGKLPLEKVELLKDINYPLDEITSKTNVNWFEEFDRLAIFLSENNRQPDSRSQSIKERALYRFLYSNNKSFADNELNPEKSALWESLNLNSFNSFFFKIKELEDFILTNGRRPSYNSSSKEEKSLYTFLIILLKNLKNEDLDGEKAEKAHNINTLLNNIK